MKKRKRHSSTKTSQSRGPHTRVPHSKVPRTSWNQVGNWYGELVSDEGHYYHRKVILPGVIKLLKLKMEDRVLDLACGNGILERVLPEEVGYLGVDGAPSLIEQARKLSKKQSHRFIVADVCQPLSLKENTFTKACLILALQNLENMRACFQNAGRLLGSGGYFIIVMNHPCFRIPKQSSWGIDEKAGIRYRRVDGYMKPAKIKLLAHPGQGEKSPLLWTYHLPLSDYIRALNESGFYLTQMEEWVSDKKSEGRFAAMEDRARDEFPLFLTLLAQKK